jgi:hypothetical protein
VNLLLIELTAKNAKSAEKTRDDSQSKSLRSLRSLRLKSLSSRQFQNLQTLDARGDRDFHGDAAMPPAEIRSMTNPAENSRYQRV